MPMTNATEAVPAHSMFKVLAALGALAEATAGEVAEHAGLGYSTTTAKLRAWEQTGQVERFHADDGRAVWRLTDTGRTATATAPTGDGQQPSAAQEGAAEAGDRDVTDERPRSGIPATPSEPPIASATDQAADHTAVDTAASTARSAAPPALDDSQETLAGPTPDEQPGTQTEVSTHEDRPDTARRGKGSLRGAILDILEAHPDRAYKTGELCKLIDAANAGTGAAKASAGAVANAATKLVADGLAVQTVERPATFQVSPTRRGNQ
ncbi:MarR family transcriptional regulator [Micromonospora sp. WMMC415]|uniref:winged helix-turn-helix transcriptional regulator n=1 Tax=Micromonospora sp. WMMC415 TaxID=2675222 RepID=UPI0012B49174|nr:winged helix-turn-helix transcriptional regulator [Micromonospora sp. WMMC415]QGN49788.1 MarR family transcriptional regulator [Micromonospora sp. WMMC415]